MTETPFVVAVVDDDASFREAVNRVFTSYEDILDHCCHAWNKLIDQPWKIMSIGCRQWAHGF